VKLLLINPNTTASMTDLVAREGRRIARPDTELVAVTGRIGARYVASRAAYAIAGHAALDAYAEHGTGADVDAVVLACFGDPALMALKEIARQPVVGMAEAACLTAAACGGKFAIVTGGERWGPMLREFVAALGMSERLAGVHTVAPTGADIARDPDRALAMLVDACRTCVETYGADSVILGGAGLAGIAPRIADKVPVPLVDGLAAAIRMAESAVAARACKTRVGSLASPPPVEVVELSPGLVRLMSSTVE
jgi:Asp/Glu/hydantoin racemase